MGLFDGGNKANKAAEEAAKAISFAPVPIDVAGIGRVGVTPVQRGRFTDFSLDLELPEEVRAIQDTLFGQSLGALGAAGGLVDPTAGAAGELLGAGRGAIGALGAFDPLEAAAAQFSALDAILDPIRARETAGLEARLARQGILTGTSGERRLAEREAGIERERQLALLNQFESAQQAQRNLADIGGALIGQGAGLGQQLFGRGLTAATGGQQLATPLLQALGLAGDLGQARTQAQIARSGAIQSFNAQQGGGIEDILGGALGGFASSLAGPLGTAAAGLFTGGGGGGLAPGGTGGFGGTPSPERLFGTRSFGFRGLS